MRNNPSLPQGPIRIAFRIPQPPSPPGCGRIGPEFPRTVQSPSMLKAGLAPAFFFLFVDAFRRQRTAPTCRLASRRALAQRGAAVRLLVVCLKANELGWFAGRSA